MSGLGEDWNEVLDMLRKTIPRYETVNRAITLGYSTRTRRALIRLASLRPGMVVLDAGCGPGTLSELIVPEISPGGTLYLMDPLDEMLAAAFHSLSRFRDYDVELKFVKGSFEAIPTRSNFFDVILASYSFRDAKDRIVALKEMRRVLKPGGRLLILELSRPDIKPVDLLLSIYLRYIVPMMSEIVYRGEENPWKILHKTYVRMWTSSQLAREISRFFIYEFSYRMAFGSFTIVSARKPTYAELTKS